MPFLAREFMDIPVQDLLSWMFDEQDYDLDEPVYIDAAKPERTISSREARRITRKLGAGFNAAGFQEGDCICLLSFNDIHCAMAFLGVLAFGGVFSGTNPSHTAFELAHAFKTADVKGLIVEPELLPNALRAAKEVGIPFSRVFVFDHQTPLSIPYDGKQTWSVTSNLKGSVGELKSWRSLMQHGERPWEPWVDEARSKHTTAARLFSSGTTGLPKAVELSHHNLITQHTLVYDYKPRDYEVSRLICTPLFHMSNVPRAYTSPLRSGSKTYIMRRFDLEPYLANMQRFQITELNMVPPMVIQIINSPISRKYSLRAVRYGWCGAAPLAAEPQARMKALLSPDAAFNQVWGMSETSCIATMVYYPEHDPSGSVGRLLPNHDAKLVDEDGRDITDYDVAGELCVRGPLVVRGYYNNDAANRSSFDEEGYFHTGDVALRKRSNGLWYIVDRKKELIKVRGFQCAPAELEGVLLSHPDVADAGVIGIPAAGFGSTVGEQGSEVPRAYIVKKEGAELSVGDVHDWMGKRLAGYKQLVGGVKFVEAIPKNASGKILKGELRAMAKKEVGVRL